MAKKKENFKGMSDGDLDKKVMALREETRNIRFKGQGAKPKNVKEMSLLKKDIARALTEIGARAKNK